MDDHEVEQILRTALERRSAETDVAAPVVDSVRAAAAGRRRTRWSVGVAAAAVLVVVGGVAVATRGGDAEQQPVADQGTTTDVGPDRVGEWRTEYWGPVAVDVPADWGYGSAPGEADPLLVCAPGEVPGYVGRPIAITDVCVYLRSGWQPTAPYVWLGAAVEPGTYEWDNGYVQETVEVAGTTVTVGTDDPALRERILASARASGNELCRADLPTTRPVFDHDGDPARAVALRVCAYRDPNPVDGGPLVSLTYGVELGHRAVDSYLAALEDAPAPEDQCPGTDYVEAEWVVLILMDARGGVVRTDVVHTACPGIDIAAEGLRGFETVPLTPDAVEPWARNGIPAVVYGPTGGKGAMIDSFIGPQG